MAGELAEISRGPKPNTTPDPFMEIIEQELRGASRPQLEAAVEKGPSGTAAVAARILSTLKGGWTSVKSLFEKSDDDRLMEIAYEVVYDKAPMTWKEKALTKIMEILAIGKCGLKGAAHVAGSSLAIFSPTKLAQMLKGSRVQLINSRYAGIKVPKGGRVSSVPRLFLASRYSPIKLPTLQNIRGKVAKEVLENSKAEPGITREALSARMARGMGMSAAAIRRALESGTLTMPKGRVSSSRYNVPTRPAVLVLAENELKQLAENLGGSKTPAQLLRDPRAMAILARRLAVPGKPLNKNAALAMYQSLKAAASPTPRMSKARYERMVPWRIAQQGSGKTETARMSKARYPKKNNMGKNKEEMENFIKTLATGTNLPATYAGEQVESGANWASVRNKPLALGQQGQAAVEARLKTLLEAKKIKNAINLAVKYRKMATNVAEWQALGLTAPNSGTRTQNLMNMYRTYGRSLSSTGRNKITSLLRQKASNAARALRSGGLESNRLRLWASHLAANRNANYASNFLPALREYIRREASNRNATSAMRRLNRIRANTAGLNVAENIASAQRQIANRLRREQNNKRRLLNANRASRGLAPLARPIPYYPSQPRPTGNGNLRPTFEAPPNQPQFGAVPRPMPQIPPMPIMAPIENTLPPAEKNAVLNAGGANKALNLVENAGGLTNVVKTANILKSVGNNPNAAVAAGANAKNVKIVLQLGGANNALKVASAVPKLKKRRRSKAKKAAPKPKPPRVKEIKKLIEYLGSKENLVKRLPNKENKEKKLTKKQIVSKITRHLLRKN